MDEKNESRLWRIVRGLGIIYIALIGIFAIEELQRREKLLALMTLQETEMTAALAVLGNAQVEDGAKKREVLVADRAKVQGLRARLTALMIGDAIRPAAGPEGTLKEILCELTAIRSPSLTCGKPAEPYSWGRELAASLVLKRTAEQRASGDIFAVLIIVAAVAGALIRLYLPGESEADAFRTVFRALGGGVVCYLAISGGTLPFGGTSMTGFTSPASGALVGLISGMFSTRVFKLLSALVGSWVDKLMPAEPTPKETPAGPSGLTVVAASSAPLVVSATTTAPAAAVDGKPAAAHIEG